MNKREAIERIRDHMEAHRIGEYPHIKLAEALNMAITALQAQNTTLSGTYVSIEWFNAIKSELDALKAERAVLMRDKAVGVCKGCKNLALQCFQTTGKCRGYTRRGPQKEPAP